MHETIRCSGANLHLVGLGSVPPLVSLFTVDVEGFPPETQVCVRRIKDTFKEKKSQPNVADFIV